MKLTVQGREAYAYTGGVTFDASLPCLVFVHGALHDHSGWTLLARWFAHHGWAVLAPDLPGHPRSPGAPLASVEAGGAWLLALLDAAGVQRAALAGHSMGSLIALEAAGQAPERATHLLMLGSAYPMKVAPALLATALAEPLRAIDMVNAWSIASQGSKPSYPGPGMWLHGSNRALMRRVQNGCPATNLFHHEFALCDRYAGGEAAAARLACPVAMIVATRDRMTPPKTAQALAARLRARSFPVASGHTMMAEAPDAVLAALREALAAPA